ncbi:MAG: SpoIIE family protein phosphatase [Bryobacterales bacterium]|nr:SpoIIE family protein phosphatase [Bryobacterales bacterium]
MPAPPPPPPADPAPKAGQPPSAHGQGNSPASAAHAASLEVVHPSGKRTRIPIDRLPFRLGRQSDNELQLRDSRISRNHAEIRVEHGEYVLHDLRSSHGSFVNGSRVESIVLHHGDTIDFGFDDSYRLQFQLEGHEISRLLHQLEPEGAPSQETANLSKLTVLLEVARALQSSLGVKEVLTSVVDAAISVTGSERGFLLLLTGDKLEVTVARTRDGRHLGHDELRVPSALILTELKQRRELLTMNFDPGGANFDPQKTIAALDLRTVICIPLIRMTTGDAPKDTMMASAQHQTVGVLYLDSRELGIRLTVADRELLQTLALEASNVIENARLLEEEHLNRKIQEELEIARGIQQSLLPRELPRTGWFRAAGVSIPSQNVAGDYFDVRQAGQGRFVNIIVDVSGKGVSSALLASLLQGIFIAASSDPAGLPALLSRTNEFLLERTEGEKFATMFYCILDRDGTLHWTNCGHCAGIHVRPGHPFQLLRPTSMPIGMMPDVVFDVRSLTMQPGDKIFLYSDGLSEAHLPPGASGRFHFYGEERIGEILRANEREAPDVIQRAMLRDVQDFLGGAEQTDDVTMLVLEFAPTAAV